MHLTANSDVIWFIREWDQLRAKGRVLSELLDEAVLSQVLNETPNLREQLRSTVEIDRHRGEFKGFSFDLETIAQIIWTGDLPNLQVLDLSHGYNDIQGEVGVKGTRALARALRSGKVPFLQTIDLWGNPIGDPGVTAIADALESGAVSALKRLAIGPYRIEGDMFTECPTVARALEALARALASRQTPLLEQLSLYRMVRGDEGVKLLMKALNVGGMVGLKRLRLQGSEFVSTLGTKGVRAIADSPFFPSLVELNIAGNRIEDEGVVALLKAFRSSRMGELEILDLDRNTMSDKVLVEVAKLLQEGHHLPKLHTLRLGPTHLTSTSATAFVSAYQRNKFLVVDITHLDWPNSSLRDNAGRFKHQNRRRSAAASKDEIPRENARWKMKPTISCNELTSAGCFGRRIHPKVGTTLTRTTSRRK